MTIHEDETGVINGYLRKDGYWWISVFMLKEKYRGKGLARNLSRYIPRKSKLLAIPLYNVNGNKLSFDNLIGFYKSIGFNLTYDEYNNPIMTRD